MKLGELLSEIKKILEKQGIIDYICEAEIIFSHILNKDRLSLYLDFNEIVDEEETEKIIHIVKRRIYNREPVQYIFGSTFFYGYLFKVSPSVLIPRKETELLVEEVIELAKNFEHPKILDLCTGSGAIAISLAKVLEKAEITASDISEEALKIAKENAILNKVNINFIQSDLFNNINNNTFDIVVSNPPYVSEEEYNLLNDEIKKYEPKIALLAGNDGLLFYKKIIKNISNYLKKNSRLALEIGYNQLELIKSILKENDFEIVKVIKDYQGINRVIIVRK